MCGLFVSAAVACRPHAAPCIAPIVAGGIAPADAVQSPARRRERRVGVPAKSFFGEPCRPARECQSWSFSSAAVCEPAGVVALSGNSFSLTTTTEEDWKYKPVITQVLSEEDRAKGDLVPDPEFWSMRANFDKQADDFFIQALSKIYENYLVSGMRVFDMMSSAHSYLPEGAAFEYVEGLGLVEAELRANPRLNSYSVKDLNALPVKLPVPDQYFDAVLNVCSVQYLQYPELALAEVYRILKPGGIVIFSFSNRMYFDKSIVAWQKRSESSRVDYVRSLFRSVLVRDRPDELAEAAEEASPPSPSSSRGPRPPSPSPKYTQQMLLRDWAKLTRYSHPEFDGADADAERGELVRRLVASLTPPPSPDMQRARDSKGLRYGFLELEVVSLPAPTSGVVIHREIERLRKLGLDHDPLYAVICQRI